MSGFLDVSNLSVTFPIHGRNDWPWTKPRQLKAVTDVSLTLKPGETLGIVGESGSGKSTLARAIVGTVPYSSGVVSWKGNDVAKSSPAERRKHRAAVQMIFQDPLAALNPRMTVGQIIAEPLITHKPDTPKAQVKEMVADMMSRVGLLPNLANRYPHEFSGGQCQRIGIARALILDPELLICDEPVSALDVSVQAQVINLLADLQRERGLAMVFIAHDLSVVKHISTRIAVMYLGRLMEVAPADPLIDDPLHPYTKALISSIPIPDPAIARGRHAPPIEGDLPSPINPPSGCVFRTRCPHARPACAEPLPPMREPDETRRVACPFYDELEPAETMAERA